jgi:hypothetical protein
MQTRSTLPRSGPRRSASLGSREASVGACQCLSWLLPQPAPFPQALRKRLIANKSFQRGSSCLICKRLQKAITLLSSIKLRGVSRKQWPDTAELPALVSRVEAIVRFLAHRGGRSARERVGEWWRIRCEGGPRGEALRAPKSLVAPPREATGSGNTATSHQRRLPREQRPEVAALCCKHLRLFGTELGEKLIVRGELALPARVVEAHDRRKSLRPEFEAAPI